MTKMGPNRTHPEDAAAELRAAGYEPLTAYPGYADVPWSMRCTTCGTVRQTRLGSVRRGQRCAHARGLTHEEAVAELRAAGYEPQEWYPGGADLAWVSYCATCLATRRPTLSSIRQGKRCGHNPQAIGKDVAEAELRGAGYEPLWPYPGTVSEPWRARCQTCGGVRHPSVAGLRKGFRCKHRAMRPEGQRP